VVGFFQQPVYGEPSFAKARNESVEGDEALRDSLHPLEVVNCPHVCDGHGFFRFGFNAALRDEKSRQHTPTDPKTHFSGLSLMSFTSACRSKASLRSIIRLLACSDLSTMSSTYASTVFLATSLKILTNHAPRAWQSRLSNKLEQLDFSTSKKRSDTSLFSITVRLI
jgi:hypothetical protein